MKPIGLFLAVVVLAGSPAHAHHGYANVFLDRSVMIEGQIQRIRWANPHVMLELRTRDSTVYTALFHQGASWFEGREALFSSGRASAADPRNRYFPLTYQSLRIGDEVVVIASPPRDPSVHEVVSIKEVRRPRDGWVWRR